MQRTIRFDLTDISAVVCECTACGTRLNIPPAKLRVSSLSNCPACRADWFDGENAQGTIFTDSTATLLAMLRRAIEQPTPRAVRIGFEVAAPERVDGEPT